MVSFKSHQHWKGHMANFPAISVARRPQVPLSALFQAQTEMWVELPTFNKVAC